MSETDQTTYRLRVDPDRCQGHARCYALARELFVVDEVDGHSRAVSEEVPQGLEAKAKMAAQSCPERAITLLRR